jgi:hypothetical protein
MGGCPVFASQPHVKEGSMRIINGFGAPGADFGLWRTGCGHCHSTESTDVRQFGEAAARFAHETAPVTASLYLREMGSSMSST